MSVLFSNFLFLLLSNEICISSLCYFDFLHILMASNFVQYAHRKCVQHWCNEKGDITCEICHQVCFLNLILYVVCYFLTYQKKCGVLFPKQHPCCKS